MSRSHPAIPSDRRRWTERGAVALLLVAFALAVLTAAGTKSATFDEPGHVVAGLSYWRTGDFRLDPENGVLPQRWFGAAVSGAASGFPVEHPAWHQADLWTLADHWLNRSGREASGILMRGRAAAVVFTVALAALVWWWGRRLFGRAGGFVALLLFALNPNVLAHGALMTSDVAGALGFILFLWCYSRLLDQASAGRLLLSGAALGLLVISKMNAVLAVPIAGVLAVIRVLDARPLPIGTAAVPLRSRWSKSVAMVTVAALHVPVALGIVWAAYGFRFAAHPTGDPAQSRFPAPWEWVLDQPAPRTLLGSLTLDAEARRRVGRIWEEVGAGDESWSHGSVAALRRIQAEVLSPNQAAALEAAWRRPPRAFPANVIAWARRHRLLPEACLYGYAHVWRFSRERGGFLNGEVHPAGSPWFFPFAFAVKTPLALLGVLALAAAVPLVRRWRVRGDAAAPAPAPAVAPGATFSGVLPLLTLLVVYGTASIGSGVNLGVRHLMPLFPALAILGGAAAYWLNGDRAASRRRAAGGALVLCLLVLLVEAAAWHPNFLSYFNGLVRPSRAYRHLVDSSLDWGHDLPALRRRLAERPANEAQFLAYFGTASPSGHGIQARQVYSFPAGDRALQPPLKVVTGPRDDATLIAVLKELPDYDPRLVYPIAAGGEPATLLVKRAAALELGPGRYWISASLLQPVHYPQASGAWSPRHEKAYRELQQITAPLRADARATRVAALQQFSPEQWRKILRDFEEYRFARLTNWLRRREPDDHVNHSILGFDVSAADLAAALEGAPTYP